jgi:hypothetical protein
MEPPLAHLRFLQASPPYGVVTLIVGREVAPLTSRATPFERQLGDAG